MFLSSTTIYNMKNCHSTFRLKYNYWKYAWGFLKLLESKRTGWEEDFDLTAAAAFVVVSVEVCGVYFGLKNSILVEDSYYFLLIVTD